MSNIDTNCNAINPATEEKTVTLSPLHQKLLTSFLDELEERYGNSGSCEFNIDFLTSEERNELAAKMDDPSHITVDIAVLAVFREELGL